MIVPIYPRPSTELDCTDFSHLPGLKKEIKSFLSEYGDIFERNLGTFLRYYKGIVEERRKTRKNEMDKQREIREENESKTLELFRKTHEKSDENIKQYKSEHHSRWLIEKEIRKKEDEKEKEIRNKKKRR